VVLAIIVPTPRYHSKIVWHGHMFGGEPHCKINTEDVTVVKVNQSGSRLWNIVPVPSVMKRFRFHLLPLSFTSCRGDQTDIFIPSVAGVKNEWWYTSTATICLHDVQRENFTLFPNECFLSMGHFSVL
jgi:hypothetical protein